MKELGITVYTIKVSLRESKPPIWRCIEVTSTTTLSQLHRILQVVMGWEESHLHEFRIAGKAYGEPERDLYDSAVLDERRAVLGRLISSVGASFEYMYDFGDDWLHDLLIESIALANPRKRYPVCLDGARSAPPEDVGGIPGYELCLKTLFDMRHPQHREMLAWHGRFDPEYFPITSVNKLLRAEFPVRAQAGQKSKASSTAQAETPPAEEDFDRMVQSRIKSLGLPPQKTIRQ